MTPSDIEKSRKEFEAAFNVTHGFYEFYLKTDGKYNHSCVQQAWKIWQASRESLVVEIDVSKIIRDCVLKTELGAYAQSNLSGGFGLIDEIIKCVMQSAGINYRERG